MDKKSGKKSIWGVIGTIAILLFGKLKYVLVALKFLKLQTLVSMFIYLGTYALIFGWKFAVALVYLLIIHETGHMFAAKKIKLPVSPAIFIPFMGAVIGLKEMPKNAKDEAYIAYMGPLFGLLSFLPAIPLYLLTNEPFWALLIILGGMINLFNLIPLTPLDGGRIAAGISTKLWGLGLILLLAFSVMKFSILGFIIVIIGSIEWYKIYKKQKNLHKDTIEVDKLEQLIENIKLQIHDYYAVHEILRSANKEITNPEVNELFKTYISTIEKIKREVFLQQLSGIPELSEEDKTENQQVMEGILKQLEEKAAALKSEVHTTETYYKTDLKTKVKLFFIYIALAIALSISYYYGNEILLNHPEIQRELNR